MVDELFYSTWCSRFRITRSIQRCFYFLHPNIWCLYKQKYNLKNLWSHFHILIVFLNKKSDKSSSFVSDFRKTFCFIWKKILPTGNPGINSQFTVVWISANSWCKHTVLTFSTCIKFQQTVCNKLKVNIDWHLEKNNSHFLQINSVSCSVTLNISSFLFLFF